MYKIYLASHDNFFENVAIDCNNTEIIIIISINSFWSYWFGRENLYETIPHNILSLLPKSCPNLPTPDLNIVRLQTNLSCCAPNQPTRHQGCLITKTIDYHLNDPEIITKWILDILNKRSRRFPPDGLLWWLPTPAMRRHMNVHNLTTIDHTNSLSS